MMSNLVELRGDGIAARCAAHLLQSAGIEVGAGAASTRARVPAIMIGQATQQLFEDVFQRDDLFRGMPRIHRRVVSWGPGSAPKTLPHSAVVASEDLLFARLGQHFDRAPSEKVDWTMFSAGPLPHTGPSRGAGSRTAFVGRMALANADASGACWVESLPAGWLFLLPDSDKTAWLLCTGPSIEANRDRRDPPSVQEPTLAPVSVVRGSLKEALLQSRLIAPQVGECLEEVGEFRANPRIAWPLAGDKWLACGTAAIGFDPLCGDGSGNAIREGILASALIRAALQGQDRASLVEHYHSRLLGAFRKHLENCLSFYRSGGRDPWWLSQATAVSECLTWCAVHTEKLRLDPKASGIDGARP